MRFLIGCLKGNNMHPVKYVWALRALFYKLYYSHIGKFTYIGKPLYMEGTKRISIGERVRIYPGIRVEALKNGNICIGNNTVIEQNVHIISGYNTLDIGENTTISANVFISNVDHEYEQIDKSVMDQRLVSNETLIGKGCFLGYGSVILPGTKLGNHCIVGANTVVRGSYPDNCVIVGIPAKIIKRYNSNYMKWEKV